MNRKLTISLAQIDIRLGDVAANLAHWRTLIRARAIENQCYFAAVNRVGSDRNNTFCGHSAIIDPWGEVVVEAGESEALLTATIDLALVDEVRSNTPVLSDRRPECYQAPPCLDAPPAR